MTHSERAHNCLRDANKVCSDHPWTIVYLLVQAVVFALLDVSQAIEDAGRER